MADAIVDEELKTFITLKYGSIAHMEFLWLIGEVVLTSAEIDIVLIHRGEEYDEKLYRKVKLGWRHCD